MCSCDFKKLNMKENLPDILFVYPDGIPDEFINNEISEFYFENLDIKIQKKGNEPFSSFEWIYPTAFIVCIFKPYFEGFMSEAGKDHYQILKKGLKKYIEKGKLIDVKLVAATQSTKKLSENYNQSLSNNNLISLLFFV